MEQYKITLKDWHHKCGDGCCDEWGCTLTLLDSSGNILQTVEGYDQANAMEKFLESIGYLIEDI